DNILNNTDKTIFVCHLEKPLVLHKRIVVTAPPLAEHENGFGLWVAKITTLAKELSISIQLYCNEATQKAVERLLKKQKLTTSISIYNFTDWEDFLILSKDIHQDDLFVLISARKGAASHMSVLENLPSKLEKYFPLNSRFVVYPQQFENFSDERYTDLDISSEPLNKGIETVQKIGKEIGSIFKKKEND